jgi:uncharacterized protein
MPKKTEYEQGTPSWVDLQTTDQDAGKKFYAALLGWSYDDRPMPQGGTYSMALVNGETVAAIAPMAPGAPEGVPPMWNTYIAADDVDATLEKVAPAGGQVLMPAMDVGDAGRMAFVADPTGAVVGLWQPNRHIGATLVNEPGAIIWNELITDKPDSALAFYEAVLGVTSSTVEMGPGQTYQLLKVALTVQTALHVTTVPERSAPGGFTQLLDDITLRQPPSQATRLKHRHLPTDATFNGAIAQCAHGA